MGLAALLLILLTSSCTALSIQEPKGLAFSQQTPHSGRHFYPSHPAYPRQWLRRRRRRFMEGWYYRLTIDQVSFALIVSIEDPGTQSDLKLACIQVVGPDDGYLVQADRDDSRFWAWKDQQGLGCVFDYANEVDQEKARYETAMETGQWAATVKSGFQFLPTHFLGRIRGHDGSLGGVGDGQGLPGSCDFDFTVDPVCGWGRRQSTGGWLACFAVFEPHWQVTMADGRATGSITWQNTTYHFTNAPFYVSNSIGRGINGNSWSRKQAEKNWGAALPSKWYWTQCNSFDGYPQLSITAGGGIRKIPFGRKEALGMVSVHYNGTFYEGVPWSGAMDWKVSTWGSWELRGNSTYGEHPFEAIVSYRCDPSQTPGLVFRAPTPDEGMVYFCRDTFEADTSLTLWELEWDSTTRSYRRKSGPPLIENATSRQGGAEIGGGPWWGEWSGVSRLKQPIKALLQLPTRVSSLFRRRLRRSSS